MVDKLYWVLARAAQIPPESSSVFLSPAEQHKLSGLRFPKRRREWLLGRWTAKSLLHSLPTYRQYSLAEIEILNSPEGIPRVHIPQEDLALDCLSISHRDDMALCALADAPDLKIGADLEKIEARAGNFVQDYFTPAEQALVASSPEVTRDMLTTLIWSMKEAVLKALGVGLRLDTRRVEIRPITGLQVPSGAWQPVQVATASDEAGWFARWQCRGDYILSLAGFPATPKGVKFIERKL